MDRQTLSEHTTEIPRFIRELREFLAIPSISTLPEHRADVRAAADWLCAQLRRIGMEHVELLPTAGFPVVYGDWLHAEGAPTVLIYGHYDVQPVDPLGEWVSDPFAGDIRGEYMYARGASDMKGQIFACIKALEACFAGQGRLPVNVKLMIEGEEEIGSPHLLEFIRAQRERLACDVVLNCDAGIHAVDQPSITYALRGLAYFEVEVQTADHDLHSGLYGGSIRNPIHVLCEWIARTHDEKGRVTVRGFYDDVIPLDEEEREVLRQVPYSDEQWKAMTGAEALFGEEGFTTLERIGARPTLEINGIWGGFTGEGAKTVLPARAHAKVSMRLVPNQRPEAMYALLEAHLKEHMPPGVRWTLRQHSAGPGAVMNRKSKFMRAACAALEETFGRPPVWKREGGSVPVVALLKEELHVDTVMLGFALPDDNIHGPNERQHLDLLVKGMQTYLRFFHNLADLPNS